MHFDDRLATVLKHSPSGPAIARVQYVQLLDLLGNKPRDAHGPQLESAYDRLLELSSQLDPKTRLRLVRQSGLRIRSPRLLAQLAEDETSIAAAAIGEAELREEDWLDLIPALPVTARGILRHRKGLGANVEARLEKLGINDRGLPPGDIGQAVPPIDSQPDKPATHSNGIGAIVKKIEAYRKEHPVHGNQPGHFHPRLPLGDAENALPAAVVTSFDFTTDPGGRICASDRQTETMVVGFSLASAERQRASGSSSDIASAMRARQPITGQIIVMDGAPPVAGSWHIDAVPLFDQQTSGFRGYAGRARRVTGADESTPDGNREADRMRQILHELRTPAGAIQVGAELIQQQLYGPAPHEYRAIAASIASDIAHILAGFEELDRMVKLDTGSQPLEAGEADLARLVNAAVMQVQHHTRQRESGYNYDAIDEHLFVALDQGELERLLWRLLAGVAGATGANEQLDLNLHIERDMARLDVALPASLAKLDDEELFNAQAASRAGSLSSGMFGLGFTLRLSRAEAKAAGGSLCRNDKVLQLRLPLPTCASENIR